MSANKNDNKKKLGRISYILVTFLLLILSFFCIFSCKKEADINYDGIKFEKISYSKNYRVSKVDARELTSTNVVAPANYNGGDVTEIGESAFKNCTNLTSIKIPSSVTTIGRYAFYGCNNLTNIALSEGIESIYGYAFSNCSNPKSVSIPSSVTTIGYRAFDGHIEINYNGTKKQWLNVKINDDDKFQIIHCIDGDIYTED